MFVYVSTNLVFANDQTYVIGIGVGGASYKEKPEFFFVDSPKCTIGLFLVQNELRAMHFEKSSNMLKNLLQKLSFWLILGTRKFDFGFCPKQ